MKKEIIVEIESEGPNIVATIDNEQYKMVVYGKTISECFEQLAISINVSDEFLHKEEVVTMAKVS